MLTALRVTDKLYRIRDTAKRFFGAEFQAKIAPYDLAISRWMKKNKISDIEAAMQLAEHPEIAGSDLRQMLLFSALIERLAPSK